LEGKRTRLRLNVIFEQAEKKQKNIVLWPAMSLRVHIKYRVYTKQKFKKNYSFEQCRVFLNGLQQKQ